MFPVVAAITAPAQAVTVPLDDIAGILVVSTKINGQGPYHFVLDTGAGITVLSTDLAKKLQLQGQGGVNMVGSGAQSVHAGTATLNSVSIGDASQSNVAAAIVPLPPSLTYQGRYGTIDGIVGYTFLRNYAVTFDVAGHRASFVQNGSFAPPADVPAVPVTFSEGRIPVVQAQIDGVSGKFELDSGNNGAVAIAPPFATAASLLSRGGPQIRSQYEGVGGRVDSVRLRLGSVRIGSADLQNVAANVAMTAGGALQQDRLDGLFGYDVLRQFVLTVDYAGSRAYLQPGSLFNHVKPVAGTGVIVTRNADGTFGVTGTIAGSPAAKAGVKAGDTILAVGSQSATEMSEADYNAAIGAAGTRVAYTLRSGDRTRRVVITTIDALPVK